MSKYFSTWPVTGKVLRALAFLSMLLLLGACGNSGSSVSGQNTGTAITIDNAGVIPVFGTTPTATVIYVHNNSAVTISGINYSVVENDHQNSSSPLAQNNSARVDGSQCVAIAAGQSCALKITTPQLSEQSNQGSMLIKADYQFAKQAHSFSQLINYAVVEDNLNRTASGVKFKSGATISGYGNPTGYATLYLYATGANQNYKITDLTSSQPSLKFNLNLNNVTLAANSVQAIEVISPILASSISASLSVKSSLLPINTPQNTNFSNSDTHSLTGNHSLQENSFSDSVSLAVEPISAGAILIAGAVPLIDTTTGNVSTITFLNSGNQAALTGVASADNGLFGLSGDCDNQTLAPGTACTIFFQYTESGGSGSISVPYTGGSSNSASGNVTWFNGKGAALVSIAIADNPLAFSATVGGSTEVTVKNIGGYTLTNITIPTPRVVGGSATAEVVLPGAGIECIDGGELPIGSSCTYFVAVSDSATDLDQQINLGFSASYAGPNGTQAYSRVAYSSTAIPKYVYITNSGNNPSTISMYSINSGVLVPFSPESTATAGSFSGSISFTPSAANAYVVNLFGRNVSMFSVSNGLFTPLSPQSTVATQLAPGGIVINQAGTYAYVNNRSSASNSISIYSINAGGILTPLSPESTAPTQAGPMQVTFNKAGTYAYVVNQTSRTILMYSVDPSGMLTPFTPESTVNTQNTPSLLTFNSAETYAYLTNLNSNSISMYSVNSNGLLTPLSPESTVATESTPASFVLDSSNTHAYVVNGNSQSVSMYDIINGVLVPMSPESTVATQNTPNTITFDVSGKYAYVINQISSTISMYNVNISGVLMPISPESTVPTQGSPSGPMLIDPSNSFAYVANSSSNTISMYRILDGVLIPLSPESTVATQTGAVGLTFGPY